MKSTLDNLRSKYYMFWKVSRTAYNDARDAFLFFISFKEKIGEKVYAEFVRRIMEFDFAKAEVAQELIEEAIQWSEDICKDLEISDFLEEEIKMRLHSENAKEQLLAYLLKAILACGEKKEKIENDYIMFVLDTIIDAYAEQFSQEPNGINNCFCLLPWGDSNRNQLPEHYIDLHGASHKLLGAAGSGKTTQAWHYYLEALELARENIDILPIWIELKLFETYKKEDLKLWILELIAKVTGSMDDAKNIYKLLLENGKLVLFLDGYNEAIGLDDTEKTVLREDIEFYEKNRCQIILTNRIENSRTYWLSDAVQYRIRAMDEGDIERFICKYESEKDKLKGVYRSKDYAKIREYMKKVLEDDSVTWELTLIPAKLDMVFRNFKSEWMITKATKTAFEEEYLEYLISREQDKGENEKLLKGLLSATVNQDKEVYFSGSDSVITNEEFPQRVWNLFNGIDSYRYLSLFVEMGIFNEDVAGKYKFANEVYFNYVKRGYRETDTV